MLEIRRRSHAHEILEGELFAGFISVNRGLGNKGRPGEGIIEIDICNFERSGVKRRTGYMEARKDPAKSDLCLHQPPLLRSEFIARLNFSQTGQLQHLNYL